TTLTMKSRSAMLSGGLTVKGNNLYVGSEKAVVYALHTDDGRVLWETPVAGEALSHPVVVSDGLVLIHTRNGILKARDEENGAIKW
ncbi:MAG: PQQ-binding-like beta-propeller repeat protein, partial [Candidatus Regiella insecticola]|nr:PQQ-binding-like beta-propeller repeat protein [Candidatus Regiella insecticola]